MSTSFVTIVNSLRSVRNDCHEHLNAVPQYEAFLLVESSTRKVADTLQGIAPAMAADVVEALETAKAKFRQHLANVPEYRTLLAIDKLISDVATDLGVQLEPPAKEAVQSLSDSRTAAQSTPTQEVAAGDGLQAGSDTPVETEVEAVLRTEVFEQVPTPIREPIQARIYTDLTPAEAISQVQNALQAEPSHPTLAEQTASTLSEGGAQAPVAEPPSAETLGHEAERAA